MDFSEMFKLDDTLSFPPLPDKTPCAKCGKTESPNASLRRCSKCRAAPYCSIEWWGYKMLIYFFFVVNLILILINSQEADWPSHKPLWFVIPETNRSGREGRANPETVFVITLVVFLKSFNINAEVTSNGLGILSRSLNGISIPAVLSLATQANFLQ